MDRGLDKSTGSIGITNSITGATANGITFNGQGLITGTGSLLASDLPVATTTTVGGVTVSSGSGLSVSGTGDVSIANSVTGATVSGITFDSFGSITAATSLVASDLPAATTGAIGGVSVNPTNGLEVDGTGSISIVNSGVTAGDYPKVTVNAKGIVTAGSNLAAADIPGIDASKITSGEISMARVASNIISGDKLADLSTVKIGGSGNTGGVVTFPTPDFDGQFFYDSLNDDLYIYDGNAYQPITITSGEIIFAGTYDASTNLVASVTTQGQAAGIATGNALPAASADNVRYYLVVSELGTGTSPAPTVSLNPPDILLSNGASWDLLDVSSFVAAQQAANIAFTAAGNISSTNVQGAIEELDTEKLSKTGGTITGELLIGSAGSLVFEGSADDANELTFQITNPTADRTLTFGDVTGTVVTTGDTESVTSTMIANDTIVNGDIKSDAAIAFSKLASLTDSHILVGNGSGVPTAVAITGDIGIDNTGLTSISAGAIVNDDISATAAISGSKVESGSTTVAGVLQLSDATNSASTTLAATANAVRATKVVADAALPKSGGTVTGALNIATTGSFVLKGASFDTTLGLVAPTAARSINLPDLAGTVALTSQLDDGTY